MPDINTAPPPAAPADAPPRSRLPWAIAFLAAVTLAYILPLRAWLAYAWESEVHSYTLLVPFVCAYLLYIQRRQLPRPGRPSLGPAAICGGATLVALAGWFGRGPVFQLSPNDAITSAILSFVCLLAAGGFLFQGRRWMAAAAFPVAFLIFMVPLPDLVVDQLEKWSMAGSAEVSDWLFALAGVPVLREDFVFRLPNITIRVAQECSGIRSSLVLFITSLLAAHLFLRTRWRKVALVAFIIPLGLLRNGFRILVIGWLCVHVGPEMIHHAIHKRGGPVFFALSLPILLAWLWWLRRGEAKRLARGTPI